MTDGQSVWVWLWKSPQRSVLKSATAWSHNTVHFDRSRRKSCYWRLICQITICSCGRIIIPSSPSASIQIDTLFMWDCRDSRTAVSPHFSYHVFWLSPTWVSINFYRVWVSFLWWYQKNGDELMKESVRGELVEVNHWKHFWSQFCI